MPLNNPWPSINFTPYHISRLFKNTNNFGIAPGGPEFIVTENYIKITTESGQPLITEG